MIEAEQAAEIEARLAKALGVSVEALRDFLNGNIRAGGARRTGYRFIRGTHGGSYVRDPQGTDILPAGFSVPA
jgi:hypothetical protein